MCDGVDPLTAQSKMRGAQTCVIEDLFEWVLTDSLANVEA